MYRKLQKLWISQSWGVGFNIPVIRTIQLLRQATVTTVHGLSPVSWWVGKSEVESQFQQAMWCWGRPWPVMRLLLLSAHLKEHTWEMDKLEWLVTINSTMTSPGRTPHLWAGAGSGHTRPGLSVPNSELPIFPAASGSHHVSLPWTPTHGLNTQTH